MANIIELTSFTNPSQALGGTADGKTASKILLNVSRIISVTTRGTAYLTTGVSNVLYSYPINESNVQVTLIVTEARSAILAAANAALA